MPVFGQSTYEYFTENLGLKVINIEHEKSTCSGVLFSTENGCRAVTNYHCVKDITVGEEETLTMYPFNSFGPVNSYIYQNGELALTLLRSLFSFSVYGAEIQTIPYNQHMPGPPQFVTQLLMNPLKSKVLRISPERDLAEIYFPNEWNRGFCENYIEADDQLKKEVYYEKDPAKIYKGCHVALGYQSKSPFLFGRYLIGLKDLTTFPTVPHRQQQQFQGRLICPGESTVQLKSAGYLGFDNILEFTGLDFSPGMSGGVMFRVTPLATNQSYNISSQGHIAQVTAKEFEFLGLNTAYVNYQERTYSIPKSEIKKFLDETETNSLNNINSESLSEFPDGTPAGDTDQNDGGDTDQNDGGDTDHCNAGDTDQNDGDDPKDCDNESIRRKFEINQTKFSYEGISINSENKEFFLMGIDQTQVNGLRDFKTNFPNLFEQLKQSGSLTIQPNWIVRERANYPETQIRKNILNRLQGNYKNLSLIASVYSSEGDKVEVENSIHPQSFKTKIVFPSDRVLRLERKNEDQKFVSSEGMSANFIKERPENSLYISKPQNDVEVIVSNDEIILNLGDQTLTLKASFQDDHKKLILQSEVGSLECDNRNYLKLICVGESMVLGLSKSSSDGHDLKIRFANWPAFLSKKAVYQKLEIPYFNYYFGTIISN